MSTPTSPQSLSFGSVNIAGLQLQYQQAIDLILTKSLHFLAIQETWLRPLQSLGPLQHLIISDSRPPATADYHSGTLIIRNPQTTSKDDFQHITSSTKGHYTWAKYRNIIIGSFYLSPHLSRQEYASALNSVKDIPNINFSTQQFIIMGDFNTRLGEKTGDSTSMPAWKRDLFDNFTHQLRLDLLLPSPSSRPAWTNITAQGAAVIDYILISSSFPPEESLLTVPVHSLTTTHRLIHSTLTLHPNTPTPSPPIPKHNTKKLKHLPTRINYILHAQKYHDDLLEDIYTTLEPILNTDIPHLQPFTSISDSSAQTLINEAYSKVISVVTDSADSILVKHLPCSPLIDPLWDRTLRHLLKTRTGLSKSLSLLPRQSPQYIFVKQQLALADKTFKRTFRSKKRSGFQSWSHGLQHQSSTDTSRIISQIIRSRQRRTGQSTLSSDDLDACRNYWKQTATDNNLPQHPEPTPIPLSTININRTPPEFNISIDQIEEAINNTPINKAPGPDGITNNLLKPISTLLAQWLFPIFRSALITGIAPSDWNTYRTILIWKNKGLSNDPSKHRPIALLAVIRKIFERTIKSTLQQQIGELDFCQGGFKPHCTTTDQSFSLNTTIQQAIQQSPDPSNPQHCIVFLDITAAFPSINRSILWQKLHEAGVDSHLLTLLKFLFDNFLTFITITNTNGRSFYIQIGMPQGSVLVPLFFCVYIDNLPLEIRDTLHRLNPSATPTLPQPLHLFADDAAAVTSDPPTMQIVLNVCEKYSLDHQFKFDPIKTECLLPTNPTFHHPPLQLYNQPISITTLARYLGFWFEHQGLNLNTHTTKRIQSANFKLQQLKSIGLNGHSFSPLSAIQIYKSFIRPIIEYGMQIDIYPKDILGKLSKFQFQYLRSSLSLSPSTTQNGMLLITGISPTAARNQIIATKFWSKIHDRKQDLSFMTSHAISTLNSLPQKIFHIQKNKKWLHLQREASTLIPTPTITSLLYSTETNTGFIQQLYQQTQSRLQTQKNQQLASTITASPNPSKILYARPPLISYQSARRLFLFRMGSIPGHPHQDCRKCLLENISIPAGRQHSVECSGMSDIIDHFILNNHPPSWKPSEHPAVNALDRLLDMIDCPTSPNPIPTPQQQTLDPTAYNKWQTAELKKANKYHHQWRLAQRTINIICRDILGWSAHEDRQYLSNQPFRNQQRQRSPYNSSDDDEDPP